MRYSGSFLSLFTKFERLRRHNFAHFTSSPLEKRVIRHELLDCGWTEADQRAVRTIRETETAEKKEHPARVGAAEPTTEPGVRRAEGASGAESGGEPGDYRRKRA